MSHVFHFQELILSSFDRSDDDIEGKNFTFQSWQLSNETLMLKTAIFQNMQ